MKERTRREARGRGRDKTLVPKAETDAGVEVEGKFGGKSQRPRVTELETKALHTGQRSR